MALVKLVIPKQNSPESEHLSVEEEVIVITSIASFYKVGDISRWILNPHGLQFTTIGNDFSRLRFRKDNSISEDNLRLEVSFDTEATGDIDATLKVQSMEFVSDIPHDVRIKIG